MDDRAGGRTQKKTDGRGRVDASAVIHIDRFALARREMDIMTWHWALCCFRFPSGLLGTDTRDARARGSFHRLESMSFPIATPSSLSVRFASLQGLPGSSHDAGTVELA